MKISIIIPTLNSAKTIRDTLDSIFSQTHSDLECIVVDSNSTDSTLEIVKEYQKEDLRIHIIENQERNLYESINKGVTSASGEVIAVLNSDDFYNEDTVLENVALSFEKEGMDVCYGDLLIIDRDDKSKIIQYWKAGPYEPRLMNSGWAPPHPTLFVTKETYNQVGLYNTDLKLAADYEFMLRLMNSRDISFSYIPKIMAKMRAGGISNQDIKLRIKGWKELRLSWEMNGLKVPFLFITRRILSKITQYF